MTSAHLIFIPGVLLVGIAIGFLLGSRAAKDAYNLELRREKEREEARKRREARRAARAGGDGQAPRERGGEGADPEAGEDGEGAPEPAAAAKS